MPKINLTNKQIIIATLFILAIINCTFFLLMLTMNKPSKIETPTVLTCEEDEVIYLGKCTPLDDIDQSNHNGSETTGIRTGSGDTCDFRTPVKKVCLDDYTDQERTEAFADEAPKATPKATTPTTLTTVSNVETKPLTEATTSPEATPPTGNNVGSPIVDGVPNDMQTTNDKPQDDLKGDFVGSLEDLETDPEVKAGNCLQNGGTNCLHHDNNNIIEVKKFSLYEI